MRKKFIGAQNLLDSSPCHGNHPLLYARIPGNQLKVHQFSILFSIPQLPFAGNLRVKE
jgi:hypothetical protein